MSYKRERWSNNNEKDLEDLKYRYYEELRDKRVKIRASGTYLRCPYCWDHWRIEYDMRELERHASRIVRDSKTASFKEKAKHMGLLKYLDRYGDALQNSPRSSWRSSKQEVRNLDEKMRSAERTGQKATEPAELMTAEPGEMQTEAGDRSVVDKKSSIKSFEQIAGKNSISNSYAMCASPSTCRGNDELYVWPWMAVVANIPLEYKDGRYVADAGQKLKEEWARQGYNLERFHPLWSFHGHSGFAIVLFNRDWEGFRHAIAFEKAFEMDHRGKRDWHTTKHKGDKLYAWLAREEEYNSDGLIGKYLRKNGDLRTVSDIQREDKRKDSTLLGNLTNALQSKAKKCEDMKKDISKTEIFMRNVMAQKEKITQSYNEEMRKIQENAFDRLQNVIMDSKKCKVQLEAQRAELETRERQLKQREALNESEKLKLNCQKKMNEMALLEQKKADEKMMKLAEDQKRQKELLHNRIIELEAKLDQKHALELGIERMKGAIEVMKHMKAEGDNEDAKKLRLIEEELKEKEEEHDHLMDLSQSLIIKERNANDELQEARKELKNGFKDSCTNICVKRMGDLDVKPFIASLKRKYSREDMAEKAPKLISMWEDYLRDPDWHPYEIIKDGEDHKEVIDESDDKLQNLKSELGDEVRQAVITALNELNEYNPSGRYPVDELWNSDEMRRASLVEGIVQLLKQWKKLRRQRRRSN